MPRNKLIKFRGGTAAAWTAANPTLEAGEPTYETDTGRHKVGDGARTWNQLPYVADAAAGGSFPANVAAPVIGGTAVVGQQLTCSDGTWTGSGLTITKQWVRNNVNILGQTASTFDLSAADAGQNIRCVVTATNATGAASTASNTVVPTASTSTALPAFITDEFPGPSFAAQWGISGTSPVIVADRARVSAGAAYDSIYNVTPVAFAGKQFTLEVPVLPPSGTASYVWIGISVDDNNLLRIVHDGGANTLICESRKLGAVVGTDLAIPYDAVAHRYLSIRETGGNVYFATSPDGTVWTTRRTIATTAVHALTTAQYCSIKAGYWDGSTTATGRVEVERIFAAAFTTGATGSKSTLSATDALFVPRSDAEAKALMTRYTTEKYAPNNVARTSIPANEGGGSQTIGANSYAMTAADITKLRTYYPPEFNGDKVTGAHGLAGTITTSDIIVWAAWKWKLDEDMLRAQCWKESGGWHQETAGDNTVPSAPSTGIYHSYGIAQCRRNSNGQVEPNWNGTFSASRDCTAMSVDVLCQAIRYYFDGHAGRQGLTPDPVGNIWESVARWFHGWSPIDFGPTGYLAEVQSNYSTKPWGAGF